MSAVPLAKAYLVDVLLPNLFPAASVAYGMPDGWEAPDLICVTNARQNDTQPVYGSTRPVEETGEIDLLVSCFRAGGTQREATEAAYAIRDGLRAHFKTNPGQTLGGSVRAAAVTAAELFEDDDPDAIADGRVAQLNVVLSFVARN